MKNRVNQILLAVFLITAALYVLFLLNWLEIIPRRDYDTDEYFRFSVIRAQLGTSFHAIPCFCLQLLVCRAAKRTVLRLIPVFLLLGVAALLALSFFTSAGLDALAWIIMLCLCIAPAVGYALAWGVYGISRRLEQVHKQADSE